MNSLDLVDSLYIEAGSYPKDSDYRAMLEDAAAEVERLRRIVHHHVIEVGCCCPTPGTG